MMGHRLNNDFSGNGEPEKAIMQAPKAAPFRFQSIRV